MSEYTNYCAVPFECGREAIRATLARHRIVSIVDDDPHSDDGGGGEPGWQRWTLVALADEDKDLPRLSKLFDRVLSLVVDEDQRSWSLSIARSGKWRSFDFGRKAPLLEAPDIQAVAHFFGVPTKKLKPRSKHGKQVELCQAVGLAYFEMFDQNMAFREMKKHYAKLGYCLSLDELD